MQKFTRKSLSFSQAEDSQLTEELYLAIPEFEEFSLKNMYPDFRQNSYLVFGPLGGFFVDLIMNNASPRLAYLIVNHINELCNREDEKIDVMLQVTFFEHLTDHKSATAFSIQNLKGRALILFEEVLNSPMFKGL